MDMWLEVINIQSAIRRNGHIQRIHKLRSEITVNVAAEQIYIV